MPKTFQKLLITHLKDHLKDNLPLQVSWDCAYCSGKHSGNLLKRVKSVRAIGDTEEIELLDENESVFAVIGISKTKKLNAGKITAFREIM